MRILFKFKWRLLIFLAIISLSLIFLNFENNKKHEIINEVKQITKINKTKPPIIAQNESKEKKCNFLTDHKQYTVEIDGIQYPQYLYLSQNLSINYDCLNNSTPLKKILGWNKFYGTDYMGYGAGPVKPFREKNCPITNCEVIIDKSKLNEVEFVVVSMTDIIEEPPRGIRPKRQRWVFELIESPFYHPQSWSQWNGFFNYTADYLIESEFGINYESQKGFLWALNESFDETRNFHENKTGFMAALISNCNAANKRLEYITNLKEFVGVQLFGSCGDPCPAGGECREHIAKNFKFFFAFENSVCKDYITEKFFLMLRYDIIPVVVGGGNYTRFVPKSAFINAMDFASPKHLAEYLKKIDSNSTLYNSFFKWKKHVNFLDNIVAYGFICEMCIQSHLDHHFPIKEKVYNDFDKYWNKQTQCFSTSVTKPDNLTNHYNFLTKL